MNFDDFEFLFEPSANTQTPILKRAIGLAKNTQQIIGQPILSKFLERGLSDLIDISPDDLKKKKCTNNFGNWIYKPDNEILDLGNAIVPAGDQLLMDIKQLITQLGGQISRGLENNVLIQLKEKYTDYLALTIQKKLALEKNIDLPLWFDFNKLITEHFDEAINEQENSSNRIREFVSTLRLRLQAYLNDERIAEPLLLNQNANINEALSKFLAFILGDMFKIYDPAESDIYSDYFTQQLGKEEPEKISDQIPNQITIMDMSLIPFEVLETLTGLIGRLILEFLSRFNNIQRGDYPVVIVLEEAQNYIPDKDRGDKVSISKKVFERIAREGRKYGLSLFVSSQRPSELSKTVLSQCNSFIVHRIQNPDDQKYIKQLVSAANEDILQQLPVLPQQVAIIMGDGVRTPVQMRVNTANPKPNSDNPKFIEKWLLDINKPFPDFKNISKDWEEGKKSSEIYDVDSPNENDFEPFNENNFDPQDENDFDPQDENDFEPPEGNNF
jgi:hypothetical protein